MNELWECDKLINFSNTFENRMFKFVCVLKFIY